MMILHVPRALRAFPHLRRPRESLALLGIGVAALLAAAGLAFASAPSPRTAGPGAPAFGPGLPAGVPPAPEPLQFKQVTADDARSINAVMPFSADANPAARPFAAKFGDTMDEARALDCLTAAVYYEAAIEAPEGQRAVAQVVLNRVRHPAYPKTVCGVVFQGQERRTGCQFTFTCDGAMTRAPQAALWTRARAIAWGALSGQVFAPVGWATHYHTDWVVPYWASSLAKATKVGTHIFYRWTGGWGRGPAFAGRYAGVEPGVAKLAALSGAHGPAATGDVAVDVAVAADAALDALGADDEIVVVASGPDRMAMRLTPAGDPSAPPPGTTPPQAKVPWELRWALTGADAGVPEAALGTPASGPPAKRPANAVAVERAPQTAQAVPAATPPAMSKTPSASIAKACANGTEKTAVAVPGFADGAIMTVREKCRT